jgi:DNA-binding beta-propeller fold protein YncE
LPGGRVDQAVAVGRQPHDAAALASGTVMVTDELANTVDLIQGGRVVRVIPAPLQPGGVAANPQGTLAVVVGVRARRITEYRADGTVVGSVNCGAGPTHVVTGDGGLYWVADTNGGAVLGFVLGPHGPVQVATIPVGSHPYGVDFDTATDTLWVTLTGSNQLVGLHLDGRHVASRTTYTTVRQPNTVAVDQASGELVVTGSNRSGQLQLLSPPG